MTFSMGTTPVAAAPLATASKTARKLPRGVRSTSPNAARTASSAKAPGSPAYATTSAMVAKSSGAPERNGPRRTALAVEPVGGVDLAGVLVQLGPAGTRGVGGDRRGLRGALPGGRRGLG